MLNYKSSKKSAALLDMCMDKLYGIQNEVTEWFKFILNIMQANPRGFQKLENSRHEWANLFLNRSRELHNALDAFMAEVQT